MRKCCCAKKGGVHHVSDTGTFESGQWVSSIARMNKIEQVYQDIPGPSNRLFWDTNRWFLGTCCQETPVGGCW